MAKLPQIIIPTGYEDDQVKADNKRKLAQTMLEKGLSSPGNMQSWLQVLGSLGSTAAGLRLNKQADDMESGTNKKILADYVSQLSEFHNDEKTMAPADLVAKYRGKPFLEEALKPYAEAMTSGLKEQGEHTNFGGQWRAKGDIKPGEFEPSKPTDSVVRGSDGNWTENLVRRNAALHAQGYGLGDPATTMSDPGAPNGPMPPVSGPVGAQTAVPGGAPPSAGSPLDLSLLSPDERGIMERELARRAHTPSGSPLMPPPAGVTKTGRPYWMVNGVPYDNPEGK